MPKAKLPALSKLDEELFAAAEELDADRIEALIAQGANANAHRVGGLFKDEEQSPLGLALDNRSGEAPQAVRTWNALLTHGADPNFGVKSSFDETPISRAMERGMPTLLGMLLEAEATVDPQHLFTAIGHEYHDIVKALVEHGVPLYDEEREQSSLEACCEAHRLRNDKNPDAGVAAARYLLDAGLDPNRYEPITKALNGGFIALADLLVERGAKLTAPLVFHCHDRPALQWLVAHGGDVNGRVNYPRIDCALADPVASGEYDRVVMLLEVGADINDVLRPQPSGEPALFDAASRGQTKILELLVPRLALSDDQAKQLLAAAENKKTRDVIAKLLGRPITTPAKKKPSAPVRPSREGQAAFDKLRAALATIEKRLRKAAPAQLDKVVAHFKALDFNEVVDAMKTELIETFTQWASPEYNPKHATPIAAVVFEWGGHGTSPFDSDSLAAGFGAYDAKKGPSKSLFEDCGGVGFSAVFDEVTDLANDDEDLNLCFRLQAAALLNLALGQAVESAELAAVRTTPTLAFLAAEHDQDPILAYVRKAKAKAKAKAKPKAKAKAKPKPRKKGLRRRVTKHNER